MNSARDTGQKKKNHKTLNVKRKTQSKRYLNQLPVSRPEPKLG